MGWAPVTVDVKEKEHQMGAVPVFPLSKKITLIREENLNTGGDIS